MRAEGPLILGLWSAPRSRSTAFLRMMVERQDRLVLHHPFSDISERSEANVHGRLARSEPALIDAMRGVCHQAPIFFKDTTDAERPGLLTDRHFLGSDAVHTFLIRHPAETIPSFHALRPEVKLHQIGVQRLYDLFLAVAEASGRTPVVLDAADLVTDPVGAVRAYCAAVGIPYLEHALSWPAGERPEWRRTRHWHRDLSRSTCLAEVPTSHHNSLTATPRLQDYLDHHLPYYEKLHAHRLVPQSTAGGSDNPA